MQRHLEMDLDVGTVFKFEEELVHVPSLWERNTVQQKVLYSEHFFDLSQCMSFPTMWYVRPAKPQISLRIHVRAVWSEPLLVAWIFYEC